MAAAKPTIEERIRTHYSAGNGEWLIEKGKVKEAKLLKEAVERIDSLLETVEWHRSKADKKDGLYHGWWKEEQAARKKMGNAVAKVASRLQSTMHFSKEFDQSLTNYNESVADLEATMEEIDDMSY